MLGMVLEVKQGSAQVPRRRWLCHGLPEKLGPLGSFPTLESDVLPASPLGAPPESAQRPDPMPHWADLAAFLSLSTFCSGLPGMSVWDPCSVNGLCPSERLFVVFSGQGFF